MVTHGLSDATKGRLRQVVQRLRERLLADIASEADRRYRFSYTAGGLRAGVRHDREVIEQIVARREASGLPRERVIDELVAESASTLLHRLVLVRHMEATGILRVRLLTGGVASPGYKEACDWLGELVGRPDDSSKGFGHLLALLFDELAADLPGLFGEVGTTRLFPVSGATLLTVVEELDDPDLAAAWEDDTITGWVYQFWNDAEKARIDKKIGDGEGEGSGKGKVEAHEIAPKTALYTERYMVEWLLQNSLGAMWRAICRKNRWPCEADDALPRLAAMRAAGRVDITDETLDRWKYHVDVPLSDEFVAAAPDTIRALRLLDPACGSGHFLVAAFDWLFAAWKAEAEATGAAWTDSEIAAGIVENNLHGIDIDPTAVQLAAAAVYLKARQHDAHPKRLNLVASRFGLRWVTAEDRRAFAERVAEATAVDRRVVETLLLGLTRADTLGSLLRVEEIDKELLPLLSTVPLTPMAARGEHDASLFRQEGLRERVAAMVATRLGGLTRTDDLGVRLGAEQLAAGLRFTEMLEAGTYDVVVANPPYLTRGKVEDRIAAWFDDADLYACFLRRGLDLARRHGVNAMITMHGWMFLQQFDAARQEILTRGGLIAVAHLGRGGGFTEWADFDKVLQTAMVVVVGGSAHPLATPCFRLDHLTNRAKREALLHEIPAFWIDAAIFNALPGSPMVYWWSEEFRQRYLGADKVGAVAVSREGLGTGDDPRFIRTWWEVPRFGLHIIPFEDAMPTGARWVPYIKGAGKVRWIQHVHHVLNWHGQAMDIAHLASSRYGRGATHYFLRGAAFSPIGSTFLTRVWTHRAIIGDAAPSFFPSSSVGEFMVTMNGRVVREVAESLNPTVNFKMEDARRLPYLPIDDASSIYDTLLTAFRGHESVREPSVEFNVPGPSTWRSAQAWAQLAVDRPEGTPLPPFVPEEDPPDPKDFISFALGQCLGRFRGEAFPTRILFLARRGPDNLAAAKPLLAAWAELFPSGDLKDYLREDFFTDDHLARYENRPIHWPLSSKNRSFVAWVCIHSFTDRTLDTLRAEHIKPCLDVLERQLAEAPPHTGKGKDPTQELRALVAELTEFDRTIRDVAAHGPDPARQEVRAAYRMELDDGVRVNSACLFPLLAPQWGQPEKWWGEIAKGSGRTAADWSKSAARYWPNRVGRACRAEPSHAVAHGNFWTYHPERAWRWELRLQEEIGPAADSTPFRIDEAGADAARAAFLDAEVAKAVAGVEKEASRRIGKRRKAGEIGVLFEMEIHERGLWDRDALGMWNAEVALIKRNGDDVRLVAPDELAARARLLREQPLLAELREKAIRKARKEADQQRLFGRPPTETDDTDG